MTSPIVIVPGGVAQAPDQPPVVLVVGRQTALPITQDELDAVKNSTNPSATNPFVTHEEVSAGPVLSVNEETGHVVVPALDPAIVAGLTNKPPSEVSPYAYTSEVPTIPDALPASDVAAWAKAPAKPTYTADEVALVPIDGLNAINLQELGEELQLGKEPLQIPDSLAAMGRTIAIIGTGEVGIWDAETQARIAALVALGWPLTHIVINYVTPSGEPGSLTAANAATTPTADAATLTGTLTAESAATTPTATVATLEEYVANTLTAADASTTPTATASTLVGTLEAAATATTTPTATAPALVGTLTAANASTTPTATVATLEAAAAAPSQPVISATAGNTQVVIAMTSGGIPADSYNVKWGTVVGTRSDTITGVTLPYTHTGRTNGTPYYYSLVAMNATGSTESVEISAIPSATTEFIASTTDNSTIAVNTSWTAVKATIGGGTNPNGLTTDVAAECFYDVDDETDYWVIGRYVMEITIPAGSPVASGIKLQIAATAVDYASTKLSAHASTFDFANPTATTNMQAFTAASLGVSNAISAVGTYDIPLSATALNNYNAIRVAGGTLKYCIREYDHDVLDISPAVDTYYTLSIATADNPVTASKPRLVVT